MPISVRLLNSICDDCHKGKERGKFAFRFFCHFNIFEDKDKKSIFAQNVFSSDGLYPQKRDTITDVALAIRIGEGVYDILTSNDAIDVKKGNLEKVLGLLPVSMPNLQESMSQWELKNDFRLSRFCKELSELKVEDFFQQENLKLGEENAFIYDPDLFAGFVEKEDWTSHEDSMKRLAFSDPVTRVNHYLRVTAMQSKSPSPRSEGSEEQKLSLQQPQFLRKKRVPFIASAGVRRLKEGGNEEQSIPPAPVIINKKKEPKDQMFLNKLRSWADMQDKQGKGSAQDIENEITGDPQFKNIQNLVSIDFASYTSDELISWLRFSLYNSQQDAAKPTPLLNDPAFYKSIFSNNAKSEKVLEYIFSSKGFPESPGDVRVLNAFRGGFVKYLFSSANGLNKEREKKLRQFVSERVPAVWGEFKNYLNGPKINENTLSVFPQEYGKVSYIFDYNLPLPKEIKQADLLKMARLNPSPAQRSFLKALMTIADHQINNVTNEIGAVSQAIKDRFELEKKDNWGVDDPNEIVRARIHNEQARDADIKYLFDIVIGVVDYGDFKMLTQKQKDMIAETLLSLLLILPKSLSQEQNDFISSEPCKNLVTEFVKKYGLSSEFPQFAKKESWGSKINLNTFLDDKEFVFVSPEGKLDNLMLNGPTLVIAVDGLYYGSNANNLQRLDIRQKENLSQGEEEKGVLDVPRLRRMLQQVDGVEDNLHWFPGDSQKTLVKGMIEDRCPADFLSAMKAIEEKKKSYEDKMISDGAALLNEAFEEYIKELRKKAIHSQAVRTSPLNSFFVSSVESKDNNIAELKEVWVPKEITRSKVMTIDQLPNGIKDQLKKAEVALSAKGKSEPLIEKGDLLVKPGQIAINVSKNLGCYTETVTDNKSGKGSLGYEISVNRLPPDIDRNQIFDQIVRYDGRLRVLEKFPLQNLENKAIRDFLRTHNIKNVREEGINFVKDQLSKLSEEKVQEGYLKFANQQIMTLLHAVGTQREIIINPNPDERMVKAYIVICEACGLVYDNQNKNKIAYLKTDLDKDLKLVQEMYRKGHLDKPVSAPVAEKKLQDLEELEKKLDDKSAAKLKQARERITNITTMRGVLGPKDMKEIDEIKSTGIIKKRV